VTHLRITRSTTGLALLAAALAGVAVAATSLLNEQEVDQRQRDLIRIFSEVYQRAQSQALLGEVVRPRYGSPAIELPDAAAEHGWRPDCTSNVTAEPTDPTQYPFALILAPREDIGNGGAQFTVYAIFAGSDPLPADALEPPFPEWLTAPLGGYREIGAELQAIAEASELTVVATACGAFSIAEITGVPR
jgi:hypothetical protein